MRENVEHTRARYAFDCIDKVKGLSGPVQKKYSSQVRSAPALIHNCGLMQALAFYCSKMDDSDDKKKHYVLLAGHLLDYMVPDESPGAAHNKAEVFLKFKALLASCESSSELLMLNTGRAKAVLVWLKRFSDAMLEKDKTLADSNPGTPEQAVAGAVDDAGAKDDITGGSDGT